MVQRYYISGICANKKCAFVSVVFIYETDVLYVVQSDMFEKTTLF